MKKPVTLSLDEKLIATIDSERGQRSRSSYVESMLNGTLRIVTVPVSVAPDTTVTFTDQHLAAYRCKDNRCSETFGSPNARCSIHGSKAVPA